MVEPANKSSRATEGQGQAERDIGGQAETSAATGSHRTAPEKADEYPTSTMARDR
jgi:hypothetical protein